MNHYDLNGRVAIITGGGRGIGYAIAQRMLASGASIMLWDLAADETLKSAADPGRVRSAAVDVTDEAAVIAATTDAREAFGRIDILVNSAGITGPNHALWDYPTAEFSRVLQINLMGTFNCCKAVVPAMLSGGYGRIVNLASLAGKEGTPNACAYSASKAAVIALTKSLAKEVATRGIVVNSVAPAAARTEMLSQMTPQHVQTMLSKSPMGRLAEAEEIAAMVTWMASEECSFTAGSAFDASGGRAVY